MTTREFVDRYIPPVGEPADMYSDYQGPRDAMEEFEPDEESDVFLCVTDMWLYKWEDGEWVRWKKHPLSPKED